MNLKPRDTKKDSFEEEIKKNSSFHLDGKWLDIIGKFALIVSVLVIAWGFDKTAFDQDKNNCVLWEEINGNIINGTDVTSFSLSNISTDYPYEIQIENFYIHNTIAKCKEWKQKTKCELNITDEDCVCEEWKSQKIMDTNADGNQCVEVTAAENQTLILTAAENHYPVTTTLISTQVNASLLCFDFPEEIESITIGNTTLTHDTVYTELIPPREEKTCVKAREKNECEKGEENWIWVPTEMRVNGYVAACINSQPNENNNGCIPDKFCRKKMLDDYTCAELFEFVANERIRTNIDSDKNITGCGITCGDISHNEIVKIYKDRGCI